MLENYLKLFILIKYYTIPYFFIGMLHQEEQRAPILCKPRLLPLRPLTLETIEQMQREVKMIVIGELVGILLNPAVVQYYACIVVLLVAT